MGTTGRSAGLVATDAHGHVRALDAAAIEVALRGQGTRRKVLERVADVADWLHERRDPGFIAKQ